MQPRRFARELALLGMSQLSDKPGAIATTDFDGLLSAAVRSLSAEVHDALEIAASEVQRGQNELLESETRTSNAEEVRNLLQKALEHTQTAINRLGSVLQIPEMVQLSQRQEVRDYAVQILSIVAEHRAAVDRELDEAMVSWQVKRLPQIDRDILRMAVIEMKYLEIPDRIAINEAVEIAKRYSDDDGYRFVNGVLRRWVNRFLHPHQNSPATELDVLPTDSQSALSQDVS
jgi:N utilization substance protein B